MQNKKEEKKKWEDMYFSDKLDYYLDKIWAMNFIIYSIPVIIIVTWFLISVIAVYIDKINKNEEAYNKISDLKPDVIFQNSR